MPVVLWESHVKRRKTLFPSPESVRAETHEMPNEMLSCTNWLLACF